MNMFGLRLTIDAHMRVEERPARPQHDRRRERELDPVRRRAMPIACDERCRRAPCRPSRARTPARRARRRSRSAASCRRAPDSARRRASAIARLERHAAVRARAGPIAHHLGVHRAHPLEHEPRGRHLALRADLFRAKIWLPIPSSIARSAPPQKASLLRGDDRALMAASPATFSTTAPSSSMRPS